MSDRVRVDVDDHVAIVTLNRADKKNALDFEMFEALIDAGESLSSRRGVRAVVLHGAGDNFCAGIDLSLFQGDGIGSAAGGDLMQPREGSPANFFQSAAYVWHVMPVPVIAALSGVAFGGGLQIALGADIRFAAPDARLSIMEIKWGIIPDMAITVTARDVLPPDRLKLLAYTGRVVSGEEAAGLGLVTESVADPLAHAREVASEIAQRSPDAVRAAKRLLNEEWKEATAASLRREAELQQTVIGGPNQLEAVMANLHKRNPHFGD